MKRISIILGVLLILLALILSLYVYPRLPILNGHAAKQLCSCVFVAGIPEEKAINEDIGFFPVSLATKKIDYEEKRVTADLFGLRPITAYFREGLGCALFHNSVPTSGPFEVTTDFPDTLINWFDYIDTVEIIDQNQKKELEKALEWAFEEADPSNPKLNTRATAVIYKGQLVGERYAPGFDRHSRLTGWSMTKTVTSVLYGILERAEKVSLDDPLKIHGWEGTDKEVLTVRQLLNMSSGMEWSENYMDRSSTNIMLYESNGMGVQASKAAMQYEPGEHWYYSSGTSNILAYHLSTFFDEHTSYLQFPYDSLFAKLGMSSMRMETDAEGYFVGSSYSWATARDWAKFGLMLLNKGVFAGDTIVNADWVDFMTTPHKDADGGYGGHVWLNAGGRNPDVPKDAYMANGFHGQRVLVIPSKELVIVRLAVTYGPYFDFNEWSKQVINALE